MKKLYLIILFLVFMKQAGYAQVSVDGPSSVEVGTNYIFSFTFLPQSPPVGSTYYKVTSWQISSSTSNMDNSGVLYKYDNSMSLTKKTLTSNSKLEFPIQWGDNYNSMSDVISATVSVVFYDEHDNVLSTPSYIITKSVNIFRIFSPTLSSGTILACCSNNVQITASDYGAANTFNWSSLSVCTLVSGQGTNTIVVSPDPLQSTVSATCTVGRSTATSNYNRTTTKAFLKTMPTASFTPIYSVQPVTQYMCKTSGQQMQLNPQCGSVSSVIWVAPNCTILGQATFTPTIIPDASAALGSTIGVYATIQFSGGCTATTPINGFAIYDGATPPTPVGSINFIPESTNPCIDEGCFVEFVPSVPFVNGKISVSPAVIPPGRNSKLISFRVTYYNYCSGLSSYKNYSVYTPAAPAPCFRVADSSTKEITVSPNPTNDRIKVNLFEKRTGEYLIFDQAGILVLQGKFTKENEFVIDLASKLKSGIYLLKINTEIGVYDNKIILNSAE